MGASHGGVLAIDEGVVVLAVSTAMGHGDLDVFTLEVNDRVENVARQVVLKEILEAVLGLEGLAVEGESEPGVEVGVVPEHGLDIL